MKKISLLVGRICTEPFTDAHNSVRFEVATDKINEKGEPVITPVTAYNLTQAQKALLRKGSLICVKGELSKVNLLQINPLKIEIVSNKTNIELLDNALDKKNPTENENAKKTDSQS